MSRLSFTVAPLVEFLDEDLAEVAAMSGAAVRDSSAAAGLDRAGLVLRVRDRLILAHRAEPASGDFRGKLERFGVDALCELGGADLHGLRLAGERLARADLRQVDLSASDLTRADLAEADLRHASLARASLVAADLSGARLDAADLAGADLSNALIVGACFVGATLDGARGVPEAARRGARISAEVAALLRQLCGLDDKPLPGRRGPAADHLARAGRLILQGEWEQAARLLGVAAPDAARVRGAERLALVKAMLEMLRGDADIAGRILAEVKARMPE